MSRDPNYRLLQVLNNCRLYDFNVSKTGRKSDIVQRILILQARDAAAKADKKFVAMIQS